jgi:putative transposase
VLLEQTANRLGFQILAYCFMPDHLHLLVEGSEGSDLAEFMKRFKQISSYNHKRSTGMQLWQKSYYDHIVRNEHDLSEVVTYIMSNPVEAGLVDDPAEFPHLGGTIVEDELAAAGYGGADLNVAATGAGDGPGDLKVAATDAGCVRSHGVEGALNA